MFFSIIIKVKQHEEFFPAFHALITEILQTLGKYDTKNIMIAWANAYSLEPVTDRYDAWWQEKAMVCSLQRLEHSLFMVVSTRIN